MTTAIIAPNQRKLGTFKRFLPLDQAIDIEKRSLRFSFSSTQPVERIDWDEWELFDEVLSHDPQHVRLDRVRQGAVPLLWNHDPDQLLGIINSVELQGDRASADATFGMGNLADEIWANVQAEIVRSASFMYRVYEYEVTNTGNRKEGKNATYTAVDWELFEISLVSVPADPTVGVGRQQKPEPNIVLIRGLEPMPEELDQLRSQVSTLQTELNTLRTQVSERDAEIAKRDAAIAKLERRLQVGDRYSALRRQAESLRGTDNMKLTPAEFKELFGDDANADLERFMGEGGEQQLGQIEFYLGMVAKRSPLRNTTLHTGNEPLPQPEGAPKPVDEDRVKRLVQRGMTEGAAI